MNPQSPRISPPATFPRREFLKRSLGGAFSLPLIGLLGQSRARGAAATVPGMVAPHQTTWGINTNVDVWHYYASSAREAIAHVGPLLLETPCRLVREGLQGADGGNDLDAIDWDRWFNPWVDWLDEHGMQMCFELFPDNVENPGNAWDRRWEERITHKTLAAARYVNASAKARRVVAWFILLNEPDLKTGRKGGFVTPERLVRMHELAYQAIKSVNPQFLVEGLTFGDGAGTGAAFPLRAFNLGLEPDTKNAPETGKSVPGLTSKQLFDIGITRHCDFIGYHSYVEIAEDNPYGVRALTDNMRAAHEKSGYPILPIVNTETGCHDMQLNRKAAERGTGKKPVDVSDEARYRAIAHYQYLNVVQQARWGVARSVFYLLSGSPGAPWMHIADYPVKRFNPPAHYGPFKYDGPPYAKRPSFATAVGAMTPLHLDSLNGGFERPEDKFTNWIVLYNPHDFRSHDLEYGEWKETHFLRDGDATGIRAPGSQGRGYLKLDAGLPKIVRRVVAGLESGREYRATAWVRQEAAAKATLAVYGFDQVNPPGETAAHTGQAGDWVQLTVKFTPRRSVIGVDCWGVLSLEHDGKASAYWDDVTLA